MTRPSWDIPFAIPTLGEEEERAAVEALRSGWIAQGPRVADFERALSEQVRAPHVVATSSCTAALWIALRTAGLERGDRVLLPSYTFVATANAVDAAGCVPVFADVDPETFNLDPEDAARALREHGPVRGIVLVHQLGHPADREAFARLATDGGAVLVEDAACALGSLDRGRPVGAREEGEVGGAAFSFHPRKIVTTGEGGALAFGSGAEADAARQLRDQGTRVDALARHRAGRSAPARHLHRGFNCRMSDLNAAIGLVQLRRLASMIADRRRLAARYDAQLAGLAGVRLSRPRPDTEPNLQTYAVVLEDDLDRDAIAAALAGHGVATRVPVMACHLEPAYATERAGRLPVTERLARQALALPLHAALDEAAQDHVVACLVEAIDAGRASPPPPRDRGAS